MGASLADVPRFDYHQHQQHQQQQDSRPLGNRGGYDRRGGSKNGGAGTRSQSANAAASAGAGISMRLPPMGGSALAPLAVPELLERGEGVGIAGKTGTGSASMGINIQPRTTLAPNPAGLGGGVISHAAMPVNFSSRPIYSAPSAVSGGLALLGDEGQGQGQGQGKGQGGGGGALPPLQSLTPKIKDKRKSGSGARLAALELHQSR